MVLELRIQNYAVAHDLTLRLGEGLNVLSGETGAGKSIVVGSLTLLAGGRASSDVVRSGSERAVIEGVFDVRGVAGLESLLEDLGIEADEGHVILRREIQVEGRSRAWINGSPTTVAILKEVGGRLVDIHGQNDHQRLLKTGYQLEILDMYGGSSGLAATVREIHRRSVGLRERLKALEDRRRELESRGDFVRFQLGEIEAASLDVGEEDALHAELKRLQNSEELVQSARQAHYGLYGAEGAVSERLSSILDAVRRLGNLDADLEGDVTSLEEAYHLVVEVGRRLGDYGSTIDQDPHRLESVRDRKSLIQSLKRKYGATLETVIEAGRALRRELDELEAVDLDAGVLQRELDESTASLQDASERLSETRRDSAGRLEESTSALFPDLGLGGGVFQVRFERNAVPDSRGLERIELQASLNAGFAPGALARIASGGELSRVMLALKSVLAELDEVPTLVFDEIDAGVGGVVARKVGDRLKGVSEKRQVLVVTHLAQIACRAATHIHVEKGVEKGTTVARVRVLEAGERVREIARMLGGDPDSATSLEHARDLLQSHGASGPGYEAA